MTDLITSPLRHLDPDAISDAARKESRNREVHLPPISVFRWWARRTEAVNGAVLDAVNAERDSDGPMLVVDPFAGGGTIPLAALLRGHRVYAQDINPWATLGLSTMLGLPEPEEIRNAAAALSLRVASLVSSAYGTTMDDGQRGTISHTFRVATAECPDCSQRLRLFPHAMVSLKKRKERGGTEAFVVCRNGHVSDGHRDRNTRCRSCRVIVDPSETYTTRRISTCQGCGGRHRLQALAETGSWDWEVVLVERTRPRFRELAIPTAAEIASAENTAWQPSRNLGPIPDGQETAVLRRHGFSDWHDLYPHRQRYVIESLLEHAPSCAASAPVQNLLRLAIVGSTEMAGLCSRWDRWYLKSFESMAGHRFNFTTLPVEPNAWGTATSGRGTVLRRLDQLVKASEWLHKNTQVSRVKGPVPPTSLMSSNIAVQVVDGSSATLGLADGAADLVLTDPPYHDDVQYSELSLPLRAWAELPVDSLAGEAVVNPATGQQTSNGDYGALLTAIFSEIRRTLKDNGHLIFSYANRSPDAWRQLFDALDAAGLRAVGCEIVHSENERDGAKRNVRSCNLDLLMDLVPHGPLAVEPHNPRSGLVGEEADFVRTIAKEFLKVGSTSARHVSQAELASSFIS